MMIRMFPFEQSRGVTPEIDAKFKAEQTTRMRLLNKLKAAPSQSNRAMIKAYLEFKNWISGNQEPEDWALFALPKDDQEFADLLNDVIDFDRAMREGERVK